MGIRGFLKRIDRVAISMVLKILFLVSSIFLVSYICNCSGSGSPKIKIYNGCWAYCESIGIRGIGALQKKKLEREGFRVFSPENHPQFSTQVNTLIYYPPKQIKVAEKIQSLMPFASRRPSEIETDTIAVILGIDAIKSLSNGENNPTMVVIADKKEFESFRRRMAKSNGTPANKPHLLREAGFYSSQGTEISKVVVVKHEFKLYCYRGNSVVKSYPVAIGKNPGDKQRVGDKRTPEGDFYIVSIENSQDWSYDFGDGKGPIKGAYGPWFLRLYTGADRTKSKKRWTGIGIHGTHDPTSIGKMVTEGCIRMRNEDIEELKKLVKTGTCVSIVY